MNTNNINLNKINGEYVKFYVTTNSALPEILKNTGAIVIYNNVLNNNSYATNYIYLGGQLIASGWGLDSEDLKNATTYICNNWKQFTYNVKNSYSYLNNQIIDLNNIISNKLIKNNGNISNTYIINNNQTLTINDAIFNTVEYNYKPLEITDEENIIKYYDFPVNNDLIEVKSKNNEPLYLPIGAQVKYVQKNIKYKYNDNIKNIPFAGFTYNYYTVNSFSSNNFEYVIPLSNIYEIQTPKNFNENITAGSVIIDYNYSTDITTYNSFIIKENKQEILNNICFINEGTDLNKLKLLSYIDNENNIKQIPDVFSVKNIQTQNIFNVSPVTAIGVPCIFTYACYDKINNDSILTIKDITNIGNRSLLEQTTSVKIPKGTYIYYFALPNTVTIKEIYFIDETSQEKINITSNFIELHNNDKDYFLTKYVSSKNDLNRILYKVYCCRYFEDFKFANNMTIYIAVNNIVQETISAMTTDLKNPNKDYKKLGSEDNSIIPDFTYWKIIKNEDYIRNNWLYTNSDNNTNNIFFKFVDDYYTYYYAATEDNVYKNPLDYWDKLKKYNVPQIYEDNMITVDDNIKFLIVPYEIYKNYDFYINNIDFITDKDNFITDIFNKQNSKFVKLKFDKNIKYIKPNIKIFIGDNVYNKTNTLQEFLDINGKNLAYFYNNYVNKEFTINSLNEIFKLHIIFPINTVNPVKFDVYNVTKDYDVTMNNIESFIYANTLYGVYRSVMNINNSDKLFIKINK